MKNQKKKGRSSEILYFLSITVMLILASVFTFAITSDPIAVLIVDSGVLAFNLMNFQIPGVAFNSFGMVPTQGQKLGHTNKQIGNPSVAKQQGTTRIIYDTLPLDGRSEYRFFDGSGQRTFPRTNLPQNQFQVGESMVVKRMTLSVLTFDAVTGQVTAIQTLDAAGTPSALYAGDLNLLIANNRVTKDHSLIHMKPEFNKDAKSTTYANYKFFTDLVIPSLLQFVFQIRVPVIAAIATKELRLTVEGVGALLNMKDNL